MGSQGFRDRRYGILSNGKEPINAQAGNDSMFAMYCGSTVQTPKARAAMPAATAAPFANSQQGHQAGDPDPRTAPVRQTKRGAGVPQVRPEAWGVITGRVPVTHDPTTGGFKGRGDGQCRPEYETEVPFARGSSFEKFNVRKQRATRYGGDVCGKIGQERFDEAVYRENYQESAAMRRQKSDLHRDGQIEDGKIIPEHSLF